MESGDSHRVLQNDLDSLSFWEPRGDIEFNPSKRQVVRVTSSRRPINTLYFLHGQVLEVVTSARHLGWISIVACHRTPIQTESLSKLIGFPKKKYVPLLQNCLWICGNPHARLYLAQLSCFSLFPLNDLPSGPVFQNFL